MFTESLDTSPVKRVLILTFDDGWEYLLLILYREFLMFVRIIDWIVTVKNSKKDVCTCDFCWIQVSISNVVMY